LARRDSLRDVPHDVVDSWVSGVFKQPKDRQPVSGFYVSVEVVGVETVDMPQAQVSDEAVLWPNATHIDYQNAFQDFADGSGNLPEISRKQFTELIHRE
jgi:hypothetical protein